MPALVSTALSSAPPTLSAYASNWVDNYKTARLPPDSETEKTVVLNKRPLLQAARIGKSIPGAGTKSSNSTLVLASNTTMDIGPGNLNETVYSNVTYSNDTIQIASTNGAVTPASLFSSDSKYSVLKTSLCAMIVTASLISMV